MASVMRIAVASVLAIAVGGFLYGGYRSVSVTAPSEASPSPTASSVQPSDTPAVAPRSSDGVAGLPSASSSAVGWQSAALPPVAGPVSRPRAVAAGADRFVAIGPGVCLGAGSKQRTCHGEAWTSVDGVSWAPVGPGSGLELGAEQPSRPGLIDVAFGPAGFLAVGQVGQPLSTAVWRSADGTAWEPLATSDPFPSTFRPSAVAGTADAYLLVGTTRIGNSARAAAWLSKDGVEWTPAPDDPAMDAGGLIGLGGGVRGAGGMTAVTVGPTGYVATGGVCGPSSGAANGASDRLLASTAARLAEVGRTTGCTATIWRSTTGLTWVRQSLDAPPLVVTGASIGLRGLAAVGDRVIVGEMGPSAPSIAVMNGPAASVVDMEAQRGVMQLWTLGASADGFLAAGVPLQQPFGMWRSSDGSTWESVEGIPALPASANVVTGIDLVTAGDRIVVIGSAAETLEGGAEVGFSAAGPVHP
jgi:hypothetical protein